MRYLGVDLHTNSFTVCVRTQTGREELKTFALKNLGEFLLKLKKDDHIAVESTGNTGFFVEQVSKAVKRVVIVDPNKFDIIKKSTKKTDANDAKNLALFLSKDLLPEARMKTGLEKDLSKLVTTRATLVKHRTALVNTIHNLMNAEGLKAKKETLTTRKGLQKSLEIVKENFVSEIIIKQIEVLVKQIKALNEGIKELDQDICEKGKGLKGHENISSIKGIGDKAATTLLTIIGDVNDFDSEKKLAAYFGIVPRVRQSNGKAHYGRITKNGSKLGRTTLVQCTLVSIRYSPYLRKFYDRIKQNRGSGKAIIATARKLLNIIYNTLKNDWVFEDFANFVIA
jgi:transposase